jgi:gliding motility-associated-like protein
MPINKPGLFFLIFITMLGLKARAQTGSLGDPVLNETFGVGGTYTPIGPPLPNDVTTLHFVADKCPQGSGQYTIASSTGGCLGDTWHVVSQDRTQPVQPAGYMMVINASDNPDVFYTQRIPGSLLCPGAKYQFAVNILNILIKLPQTEGYDQPDISFIVEDANGNALQPPQNTGIIAATEGLNWVNYKVDFTAPNNGDVVVKLKNNTFGSMGNDLVLDDITVKPYGPVIDAGFNTVNGSTTEIQCLGDGPKTYHLKSFPHDYVTPQFQWQLNVNDGGWKNIDGKTQANLDLNSEFLSPAPGKYQYRVGVLSAAGASINCQTFSGPLIINVVKNPDYTLPPVTPVCEGDALRLIADGGSDYEWTLPDGTHSPAHFLDVTLSANSSNAGLYRVLITKNGCSTETQTQVVLYPQLIASVDNTELTICEGTSTQLKANGGLHYKWTPAEGLDHDDVANPMASPTKTTEYNVNISNDGCSKDRTVKVNVLALPMANAGADFTMQEEVPAKLHGTVTGDNVNFYWTPTDYIDDPTSLTPTINPPDDRTYTLHAESSDNCGTVSDEVNIRVLKKITIPTTFTPNNDGINDTWNIDKLITYPESTLNVYTRDGHEIFKTTGDAKHWDGMYDGKPLPAGVYYYVIDLKNNLPKRAGWVMLIK